VDIASLLFVVFSVTGFAVAAGCRAHPATPYSEPLLAAFEEDLSYDITHGAEVIPSGSLLSTVDSPADFVPPTVDSPADFVPPTVDPSFLEQFSGWIGSLPPGLIIVLAVTVLTGVSVAWCCYYAPAAQTQVVETSSNTAILDSIATDTQASLQLIDLKTLPSSEVLGLGLKIDMDALFGWASSLPPSLGFAVGVALVLALAFWARPRKPGRDGIK